MSVSAKERKKDAHMGPGDSFPVGPAGQHLAAAWDLAGHADNPDEVRAHIIAFAREHGLMDHLPETAKKQLAKKALFGVLAAKAKGEDLRALFDMAWHHEQMEGDHSEQVRLVSFAHAHGLTHMLPDAAHGMLHDIGIPHNHEGMDVPSADGDGDTEPVGAGHVHTVSKAFASPSAVVQKAWETEDGSTYIEGWISTPDRDLQKDITRPEAFLTSIDGYFAAGAPLSCEHNTDDFPVGHVQKAAIVKDGQILKAVEHPTDSADFEHFPNSGSGVYGRAKLTEQRTGFAVKAGNIRSFSWIGAPSKATPLPGGGRDFQEINPWVETTVSAYPVNQRAVMLAAKADSTATQGDSMDFDMNKMVAELKAALAPATETETVAKADFEAFQTAIRAEIATAIQGMKDSVETVSKAFVEASREGAGRKAVTDALTIDSDPVAFLIQKAGSTAGTDALDLDEKALVGKLTKEALLQGMNA